MVNILTIVAVMMVAYAAFEGITQPQPQQSLPHGINTFVDSAQGVRCYYRRATSNSLACLPIPGGPMDPTTRKAGGD